MAVADVAEREDDHPAGAVGHAVERDQQRRPRPAHRFGFLGDVRPDHRREVPGALGAVDQGFAPAGIGHHSIILATPYDTSYSLR